MLRLTISVALIVYLVMTVDFQPLLRIFPSFRWSYYAAGLITMMLYVLLQAFIIHRLLVDRGIVTGWIRMVRYNFISSFFGVFLPGGACADIVMAVSLCRTNHDKSAVLSSLLFARIAGLAAMVLLAWAVSITMGSPVPGLTIVTSFVLAGVGVLIIGNALSWSGAVIAMVHRYFPGGKITSFIKKFIQAFSDLAGSYRMLTFIIPAFLVMGLGRALMDYLMAKSLGVSIPFSHFIVFSTVVSLVTVLPISIAGLGVREVTFAGLFALVGVPEAVAVSISLLSFSLSLWVCLVGGILYACGGWKQSS